MRLRRELNARGSIFQSTSDTEVIIHLVATSAYRSLLDRFIDALKHVEGAYSLVCLTEEGLIACRDPLGIRPLVMGTLGDATIFASETVALDVIGASHVRSVEPGELILVSERGIESHRPFAPARPRPCIFEHVYFSRPDSIVDGTSVYRPEYRRRSPAGAGRGGFVVPSPTGVPAAIVQPRRASLRARHHPLALCRADLHPPATRSATSAQVSTSHSADQRKRSSRRRFDRARTTP